MTEAAPLGGALTTCWPAVTLVLCAMGVSAPPAARALDVEVASDTGFRVYEVRSGAADVFWTRRRLLQTLDVRVVQQLADQPSALGAQQPPRIQATIDLRLNQEFGSVCLIEDEGRCFAVTDSGMRTSYAPLADDGGIDLPLASVEVVDDERGYRVAAGRQLYWDPIGMLRFDGGRASVEPTPWFAADAYGGLLVRSSSVAGSDSFVPPGVLRLELPEIPQQAAEHVEPPVDTATFGAGLWFGADALVRVGTYFRELRERGDVVQRSAAASLSSAYLRPVRVDAHTVVDPIDGRVVDAMVEAQAQLGRLTPRVEVQRRVPRFDRGSIWAYFDVAPVSEASAGLDAVAVRGPTWAPPMVVIGATLRGRRTAVDPAGDDDLGARAHVDMALARYRVSISGFAWDGGLGGIWGADLQSEYRITRELTVAPRVSAFRLAGGVGPDDQQVGMVEAVLVSVPAAAQADVSAELVHSHSDSLGSRLGFMAWLHVGAWR